jgi:UDP-N-acetylglucosamine--N-acetylmuramyl-(pentapeptide) pyrophosphoryl-undecaprenol N-acetylglucosamine transferase
MTRFAIAAGGTGGHLFPGLAVAEVLHSLGHEVMVLTSEKHIDAVATEGRSEFRIERLPGMGLPRGLSPATLRFFGRFAAGVLRCSRIFSEFKPAAVLGMGGFTSTAPILAGKMRGLPVFVHESNAIPGKANRLNARIAGGLLIGFKECSERVPSIKCNLTGTPVRRALLHKHHDRASARRMFGLGEEGFTVLVMGGSQGATGLNMAVMEAASRLSSGKIQFIHLTGASDEDTVKAFYAKAGIRAWTGAFHHAMQDAYTAADLAIVRSGAASLTELSFFSLPSILVPYPYAAEDHQTLNAQIFSKAGAGILLPEREANGGKLAQLVTSLQSDPSMLDRMRSASGALFAGDAAERVARVLTEATGRGGVR